MADPGGVEDSSFCCSWPVWKLNIDIVHLPRKVDARRFKENIASKIVHNYVAQPQFPLLFSFRKGFNPTSASDFFLEIPNVDVFHLWPARVESKVPNIFIPISFRGSHPLQHPREHFVIAGIQPEQPAEHRH